MFLGDLRVLDLTDHRGEVGPWLLGRFGAEVIRVEPPGGSAARREPPLRAEGPEGISSFQFAAYNDNKRSIMLDLVGSDDRATFLELVAGADIVFETGPPGAVADAGITEKELLTANDRIVHVVVTPFGVDGPRADQPNSELTLAALGGPMSLQGVRDRAPLKVSIPQVWRNTGSEAAVAALLAHRRMSATGQAQWVDVSAQKAMTWMMLNAMEADEFQGFDFERAGLTVQLAVDLHLGHKAKDGLSTQVPIGVSCGPIMPWLIEEGIVPRSWADEDWSTFDHRALSGEDVNQSHEDLGAAVDELCSRYTRDELLMRGLEYGQMFAPVNTIADLASFDHLDERGFWVTEADPVEATMVKRPGSPITVDGKRYLQPSTVPRLDESGDELRAKPGRTRPQVASYGSPEALPLAGLKVADFSWVGVGPITAKYLADHGATVVKVESENRLDGTRVQPPFKDGEFGLNRSNFFGSFNTSKQSITLDLSNPTGVGVAKRLCGWADVVIDSFRPGTMDRLGLGPDDIRAVKPEAITVTTSLLGGGGPLSVLAGYGFHAAAIAGFTDLVGWPDLDPDGPWMAYTDAIAPRFLATSILAALDQRDRTGHGCHIEGAQLEIGLQLLAPEVLDYQLTGHLPGRIANRDPHMAPQGAYRCEGDDEWCAITVADDEMWTALVGVLGSPDWACDSRYSTTAGRLADHDVIDAALTEWTSTRSASDVERLVAAGGVAAGKVQKSSDLRVDPQYVHSEFYRRLEHSEMGPVPYAGHEFGIRGYDNSPQHAAPTLGEHTFEVLSDLLGMSPDEIADVAAAGALE